MTEILALLQIINQSVLDTTTRRRLAIIILAMLAMAGRITMLGIWRWTEEGGSYRTIQRFFNTEINWSQLMVTCTAIWFADIEDIFLLAGDETVVTKAGKVTHGLDRFFSSIYGRPVKGLAFLAFTLVSVKRHEAYPVRMEQLSKEKALCGQRKKKAQKKKKSPQKGKRGRPQGSKNKNRQDVELPEHLQQMQIWLKSTLRLLAIVGIPIIYFMFDGAFGNNNSLQMVRQCGLHLISKLRRDSALYFPYTGAQKKYGARRKYGSKLDYDQIPGKYLVSTETVDKIRTQIYQMQMWHKLFPDKLNIVIVRKINLETNKWAHVVLFSSDLTLAADKLVNYYRLRFQIEFNFRDAKQFWGLEDFMNVEQQPVHNFANLSMFMVTVTQHLIQQRRGNIPNFGINDLKAEFRGRKYASELLKLLPETLNELLIDDFFANIGVLGRINSPSPP
ncbi:MAG: transposase [Ardenticatenaceae bacterium]|nr:transposase [Ardenticatenaceae bacterium]